MQSQQCKQFAISLVSIALFLVFLTQTAHVQRASGQAVASQGVPRAEITGQLVTAQTGTRRLASADLNDFVIKPGQAQPVESGLPARSNTQSAQPAYPVQSVPQPTMLPPSTMPQTEPNRITQVADVGLTASQSGGNATSAGGPQWQILQNPNGPHTAILFDPNSQVVAVYLIDSATGLITLKSVRNVRWDLQIEDYNSNKPAPKDIRDMLPR